MLIVRLFAPFLLITLAACGSPAAEGGTIPTAEEWASACEPWDEWEKPAPPFRIHGETYYVGTCGIAVILIADPAGHIVVDGGSLGGGPLVEASMRALGFHVEDVAYLLHTHEHFDHVGGLAYLQKLSAASVLASPEAAPVLRTGMSAENDPQAGMHDPFEPVEVAGLIRGGETVSSGSATLTAIATPGHTPGALSWRWTSCEEDVCREIVLMDSLSAISSDDYRFSDHPELVAGFRQGLQDLSKLPCDIALTPHPSASRMIERIREGEGLIARGFCETYARQQADRLDARLTEEMGED